MKKTQKEMKSRLNKEVVYAIELFREVKKTNGGGMGKRIQKWSETEQDLWDMLYKNAPKWVQATIYKVVGDDAKDVGGLGCSGKIYDRHTDDEKIDMKFDKGWGC